MGSDGIGQEKDAVLPGRRPTKTVKNLDEWENK